MDEKNLKNQPANLFSNPEDRPSAPIDQKPAPGKALPKAQPGDLKPLAQEKTGLNPANGQPNLSVPASAPVLVAPTVYGRLGVNWRLIIWGTSWKTE